MERGNFSIIYIFSNLYRIHVSNEPEGRMQIRDHIALAEEVH